MEANGEDARSYHILEQVCASWVYADFIHLKLKGEFKNVHPIIIWKPDYGFIYQATIEGSEIVGNA